MDFGTILHVAKKNSESQKDSSRYYSTKFAPPKKESKDSRLSDNIKKFLERQHEEERKKKEEERQKVANLLAMRDEKSKNKIKKMLKVTKSANKSVLDDVIKDHTAVTLEGPEQPDQDDYGYVSNEANAFYQKYIEKVKDVKEDKGFAPSRPQSLKDLAGTKERVKAAITREAEEKKAHSRLSSSQSISHSKPSTSTSTSSSSNSTHVERHRSSSKPLYDPEAEKREMERKKREEQLERAKNRKPLPPPIDFQALLKLAEKKQHEPIEFTPVVKKKEPERLLTLKEKREMEERQKAKEKKFRIPKEDKNDLKDKTEVKKKTSAANDKVENRKNFESKDKVENKTYKDIQTNGKLKTPINCSTNSIGKKISTIVKKEEVPTLKSTTENKFQLKSDKKIGKPFSCTTTITSSSRDIKASVMQRPAKVPEKVMPSKDFRSHTESRPFPPPDVRRPNHSSSYLRPSSSSNVKLKKPPPKRRILDDDDEYDSEMDDFIDDGDCEEDYSAHIREIFGYDKNKYRYIDDDDAAMESNFAQVQREEYISKKIGLQEDLEDMKMEAIEKKRKMLKKKKIA